MTKIPSTVHENLFPFVTVSRSVLVTKRNVSDKSCRENQKHILCSTKFFPPEIHAVCEIMWKNSAKPDRPHITIWPCAFSCRIPKATDAHLECEYLLFSKLQQWLHQSASMLRYTYIDCLVSC
jgi:hypothetical protein